MNTPAKLGAYALGLVAVFGVTAGIGAAVGPVGPAVASQHTPAHDDPQTESAMDTNASTAATSHTLGGLQISENGYTLDVAAQLPAGTATPVAFRILGPDGRPVTGYDTAHDEDLHLIAVRRDLTGYQHVHPELAADGIWAIPLDLTPGTWRLFTDFDPAGDDPAIVLGADVAVGGDHVPQPLPEPSTTAEVDGYTVTLDGELVPGQESELTLSVSRDGHPVTDLQPYLGAYGHLVALRDGDLGYLHVHPTGEPGDRTTAPGPDITFRATAPSGGDYRLFLDFRHGDAVRTAEFTVSAGDTAAAPVGGPPVTEVPATGPASGHGDAGHAHD
ncbi:hypothetical protein SAMN05660690_2952 [Geodermatophilus telluris]|uniref:Heavy-metal-associated domain-containing protein n=1 Tax=Geodermatophilus telluris TaxID=1190417 RepID=A0A1G6QL93_9ACTN|nr:hypothetical protein [Geodermatophilus telluris]SDC92427.1 hypothetical protein SAMN05660690_2952 [Geodermatophilus telluris]